MSSSTPIRYSKSDYIETDTGNKVAKSCHIKGPSNIVLGGKTIIQPGVMIRGDLRRAGGSGPAVVIAVGKYCVMGENSVIRPPCKTYKGVFSYYPMKIGDYVSIGSNSIVEAASIGNGVEIGKNCIIGPLTIIKDNARIADNSIVGPGTIIPSLGEWGGSPARPTVTLPESTPELIEAKAKAYYARFQPE
ncbi:trimeric LpxA-like protein [Leucosporidium creatinivorum]|uniref:Dynactin subunit 5 n=1 Tax=Leucosporidium creatinivorum TaxID=106004 RepID=A0A1Y2EQM3_9BASI|nr:trimeric LpxA-like protein [Leucosporidium creatinivorum]